MNVSFNKLNNRNWQVIAEKNGIEVNGYGANREMALISVIESLYRVAKNGGLVK